MDEPSEKAIALALVLGGVCDHKEASVEEITDAVMLVLSGLFLKHGTTPENLVRVMGALQTRVLLQVQRRRHETVEAEMNRRVPVRGA